MASLRSIDCASGATPAGDGFHMPAESAVHRRTWMQWPAIDRLYAGRGVRDAVRADIARLASTIAQYEPLTLLTRIEQIESARKACSAAVELMPMEIDDMWCRDSGPTFVVDKQGRVAVVDLNFNGWGSKQTHRHDARIVEYVSSTLGLRRYVAALVAEGGALEVDGDGTVLLTESAVINANRNPGAGKAALEAALNAVLGTTKVLWLPGIAGEDITDGHIDGFARYIRPGLILVERVQASRYPQEAAMIDAAIAQLKESTDARGRRLEVVTIHRSDTFRSRDKDFFNGYANFYLCNGAVVMPQFGDAKADATAAGALAELYPERKIEQVNVDRICEKGGGIHCVTQQEPLPLKASA